MIPYLNWSDRRLDGARSPFLRDEAVRPIRITFHSASFIGAPTEQAQAIELLRELSNLPEVEAIDSGPSELPHLEIGEYQNKVASIPFTVKRKDQESRYTIEVYEGLVNLAVRISNQFDIDSPKTLAALKDVLLVQAHQRLGQDILITLCPQLLEHRSLLQWANIRTPLEAAKIAGLFLRSQGNYTWQATPKARKSFDSGRFYWVLTRHMLPSMWRYLSACVDAGRVRGDDLLYLGQSILTRCAWALEARDAIGKCFYSPQNNNTRDTMMYHFNYLTLLLVGAFDAQARVAWRAYGISSPNERYAGFRSTNQKNTLNNSGATDLHRLISDQHFDDLMTLLQKLRNTIHGAGLPTSSSGRPSGDQGSLVIVLPQYQTKLWQAAQRLGPPERWGMILDRSLQFEPYTYAVTLVEECLRQIDEIAAATNIARLFPVGYALPVLQDIPPNDGVFDEFIRKRLAILA